LQEIGIVEGLRSLLIQLDKTGKYTSEFKSPENALEFMNNDHSIILYRMVQEVIHNIIKHANANHILIEIKAKGKKSFTLTISDNGKGFDTNKLQVNNTGIGLQNIFARAKLINATVNVNSMEGNGTSIIFELTNQQPIK
jgi:signal transduction histidine kinase